jgi:hypothetical protein
MGAYKDLAAMLLDAAGDRLEEVADSLNYGDWVGAHSAVRRLDGLLEWGQGAPGQNWDGLLAWGFDPDRGCPDRLMLPSGEVVPEAVAKIVAEWADGVKRPITRRDR